MAGASTRKRFASLGKIGLLGSLYLSQGLPFGFFTQALPVLLRQRGYDLEHIGLASLLALPWALKFVWAPLVDRFGSARYGRRKSWIVPLQILTGVTLVAVAARAPDDGFRFVFGAVLLVNLLSATQDIATDGLAVDMLDARERGLANGVQVAGYRLGMVLGGGALLILFDRLGWTWTFITMALLVLVASIPVAVLREASTVTRRAPKGETARAIHFLRRPGSGRIIALILIYKTGEAFAGGMLRPFLADAGLGLPEIGWLLGTVGFIAGLLGALFGGVLVGNMGRRRALIAFGALQAIAVAGYAVAAAQSPGDRLLAAVVALEHFASGAATASLFTCMMDWSRPESSATDYTVQASAMVVATGVSSAVSGFSAGALGYLGHFGLATALAAIVPFAASALFPTRTPFDVGAEIAEVPDARV